MLCSKFFFNIAIVNNAIKSRREQSAIKWFRLFYIFFRLVLFSKYGVIRNCPISAFFKWLLMSKLRDDRPRGYECVWCVCASKCLRRLGVDNLSNNYIAIKSQLCTIWCRHIKQHMNVSLHVRERVFTCDKMPVHIQFTKFLNCVSTVLSLFSYANWNRSCFMRFLTFASLPKSHCQCEFLNHGYF